MTGKDSRVDDIFACQGWQTVMLYNGRSVAVNGCYRELLYLKQDKKAD